MKGGWRRSCLGKRQRRILHHTLKDRINEFQTNLESLDDSLQNMQGNMVVTGVTGCSPGMWSTGARLKGISDDGRSVSTFRITGIMETIHNISSAIEYIAASESRTGKYLWTTLEATTNTLCSASMIFDHLWHNERVGISGISLDREKLSLALDRSPRLAIHGALSATEKAKRFTAHTIQILETASAEAKLKPRMTLGLLVDDRNIRPST